MRVFLISSVALFREGLAEVLARRDGIELAGAAPDVDALLVVAVQFGDPDVVVLDVAAQDAAVAAGRVGRRTSARVLAINVPAREADVIACAEAGVACCLTAEASLEQLVAAIASVARGEAPCSPWTSGVLQRRVAALAAERRSRTTPDTPILPRLTRRELQIVELIDRGLSNKEIAAELCIELPTVKNHVHRILDKLGVRRRADAAALVRGDRSLPGAAGGEPVLPGAAS